MKSYWRNKMDDLLKEAIADAKAVRETALENAKMALEEAFTPRLKSMLAKKIQHEIEEEDDEVSDEEAPEFSAEDDEVPVEEPAPEISDEDDEVSDEDEDVPAEVIEIDGVMYAPVVSEEDEEEVEEDAPLEDEDEDVLDVSEEEETDEDDDSVDELDLEAILRELEDEDDEEEVSEEYEDEGTEDGHEKVAEVEDSSDIGDADNKEPSTDSSDSSKVGQGPESEGSDKPEGSENSEDTKVESTPDAGTSVEDDEPAKEAEVDTEDIDLEEVLKALSEEDEEEADVEEIAILQKEVKEHRDVVKYLRAKLNEVNLLNAKLLFTNKLFRAYGLSNEQKMKVVETFDRTKNLREIKLVFSTLAESFGQIKSGPIKESKGSSSKAVASTKPTKEVITEGDDVRARFKKLANII